MAASTADAIRSSSVDQNEEVSSSSDNLESNKRLDASGVSSSNIGGLSSMAGDKSSEVCASSSEEKFERSVAGGSGTSQEVVPTGAASVSSTFTPVNVVAAETRNCNDDSSTSTTTKEEGDKDNINHSKDEQGADSSSIPVQTTNKAEQSFKMPEFELSSNMSSKSSKHGQEKKGNLHETASSSSSSSFAVPLPAGGPKKGTFAFALPKTLPKSKHGSFQGMQGGETTPSKQKEKDQSGQDQADTSKKIEVDKRREGKEKAATPASPLPYKEPSWSGIPEQEYHLEVLKNGTILSKIALNDKPYHVFGRLASCDVQMDHPSLSRYHMILQYRPTGDGEHDPGFYAYDLGSTHGSFLNKQQLKAKAYYRMNVGHMFKLGGSTRLFILQGPPSDQEEGSEMTITELKELRQKQMMQMEEKKKRKEEKEMAAKKAQEQKSEGIDWGMGGDEEEEDSDEENPFATMETQEEREAAYIKDPKKTLRGFFEREDVELEYEVDEKGSGFSHQYVCRIQLPLDDSVGNPIYAEAAVSGKKKEAVLACALEACRILDAHGVLRQATHESKKRKAKDWAQDDYYDSDDDTFLDRTGAIEKKRKQRMKKAGVIQEKAETYDSLLAKLAEVDAELVTTEKQLEEAKKAQPVAEGSDTLDDFIASLKAGGSSHDRAQRAKLKFKVVDLRKEQFRLQKLVQIARPTHIPEPPKLKPLAKGKALPMTGSMKSKSSFKDRFQPKIQINAFKLKKETEEEVEEEEEDENEDAGDIEVQSHRSIQEKQGLDRPSEETGSDKIETGERMEDEPAKPPRVYGVTMPPPSSSSSSSAQKNDAINDEIDTTPVAMATKKKDASLSSSSSQAKRVYDVAMPPTMPSTSPEEQRLDVAEEQEEEEDMVPVKSQKIYGVALPPPIKQDTTEKRLVKGPSRGPNKAEFMERYGGDGSSHQSVGGMLASLRDSEADKMEEESEDYTDWQPPTDQKGDGRTSLNEKLGY